MGVLILATACGGPPSASSGQFVVREEEVGTSPVTPRMRGTVELHVMSYNIRDSRMDDGERAWRFRAPLVARIIEQSGADVVGVQEATAEQVTFLTETLPRYLVVAAGTADGAEGGAHDALLVAASRWRIVNRGVFWLAESPDLPGARDPAARHPRTCAWVTLEERFRPVRVVVMNTHLDHHGGEARARGLRLIADRANAFRGLPLFVLGDFNTERGDTAVERFASTLGLQERGQQGTFHAFRGEPDGPRIDFIFARGARLIETFTLIDDPDVARASDHFPVVARAHVDARFDLAP